MLLILWPILINKLKRLTGGRRENIERHETSLLKKYLGNILKLINKERRFNEFNIIFCNMKIILWLSEFYSKNKQRDLLFK